MEGGSPQENLNKGVRYPWEIESNPIEAAAAEEFPEDDVEGGELNEEEDAESEAEKNEDEGSLETKELSTEDYVNEESGLGPEGTQNQEDMEAPKTDNVLKLDVEKEIDGLDMQLNNEVKIPEEEKALEKPEEELELEAPEKELEITEGGPDEIVKVEQMPENVISVPFEVVGDEPENQIEVQETEEEKGEITSENPEIEESESAVPIKIIGSEDSESEAPESITPESEAMENDQTLETGISQEEGPVSIKINNLTETPAPEEETEAHNEINNIETKAESAVLETESGEPSEDLQEKESLAIKKILGELKKSYSSYQECLKNQDKVGAEKILTQFVAYVEEKENDFRNPIDLEPIFEKFFPSNFAIKVAEALRRKNLEDKTVEYDLEGDKFDTINLNQLGHLMISLANEFRDNKTELNEEKLLAEYKNRFGKYLDECSLFDLKVLIAENNKLLETSREKQINSLIALTSVFEEYLHSVLDSREVKKAA